MLAALLAVGLLPVMATPAAAEGRSPWPETETRHCPMPGDNCGALSDQLTGPEACRAEMQSLIDRPGAPASHAKSFTLDWPLNPKAGDRGSGRTMWKLGNCVIIRHEFAFWDTSLGPGFEGWNIDRVEVTHHFQHPGDLRGWCHPSFARAYPHLCTSVRPESSLTQYVGNSRFSTQDSDDDELSAPQKCNDCDDPGGGDSPGGDDPPGGDDNGGGVGGSVGEPLQLPIPEPEHRETPAQKGDRLIENMKRYDESCKVDPALVCGDYPFHEWVS